MSMNDPGWGKNPSENQGEEKPKPPEDHGRRSGNRPSDGPPDLDELWRDFNARINRLFGNKNGSGRRGIPQGPSGGGNGGDLELAGKGILLLGIVALFIWLASGFYIVEEGNEGVVLQFGEYHHSSPPGLTWRLPYPIQSHEVVNSSQVRIVEVGYRNEVKNKVQRESLMLTDDENIIDIQFAVQYRIKNAAEYLFNNLDPDQAVMQAAETAIREVVGKNKMDFVLYEGREQVALSTAKVMQNILDRYKVGIVVSSVTVQNVQPPEQVQAAFDDAVKAGQDRERMKNEGQSYANDVIPRAKGAAARLAEESEGYRERVTAQATGDASRFRSILTEYEKAPKVTKDRLYLETMQQIYSNVTKIIVDSKSGNQLLYLPLDKLIESTGSAAPSAQNQALPSRPKNDTTNPLGPIRQNAESDAESRDSIRNRERGARE